MPVISNKLGQSATIHSIATETITVSGNTSSSNLALAGETVVSANIRKVWVGGPATISRGANIVFTSTQSGYFDFSSTGTSLNMYNTAPITLTVTGSNFAMIEVSKLSNKSGSQP